MAFLRQARALAVRELGARLPALAPIALLLALAACGERAAGASELSLVVSSDPDPPSVGPTHFELYLTDASGAPVAGAAIEVEGNMAHAGMKPVFGNAVERTPGHYECALDLSMGGDWFLLLTGELADGRALELLHDLPGVLARRAP